MDRQIKDRYIPLKVSPLGDNHKRVLMLTAGQGLVSAAAFGAAGKKGRLRALIQPFTLCEGDLYYDPVKKLWRLKDGECLAAHETFRDSLKKHWAALFWGELIIKTHGGAGSRQFFSLTSDFLDVLDRTVSREVPELLFASLWDYLQYEGIRPDPDACARCGRTAPPDRAVCYDPEGHVICARCRVGELPVLSSRGRSFLSPPAGEAAREELLTADRRSLGGYLLSILQAAAGSGFDRTGLDILLE